MEYRKVGEEELQALFNRLRIWERYETGELVKRTLKVGRYKSKRGDLRGTRWEYWGFYEQHTDREIARTHQHVRRNGAIAGSGKPDPKRLFHDGVLYDLDTADRRRAR